MGRYGSNSGLQPQQNVHTRKSHSKSQVNSQNDQYMGRYGIHLGMESHEFVNHRPDYNNYNKADTNNGVNN